MKILITKDTMSEIYLDAVRIRQKVFVQEQGVPANLEIDGNEAYSVHFVLYTDDKKPAATVRLLPLNDHTFKLQRMAVLKEYRRKNLGSEIITEAEAFAKQQHYKTIELGAQLSAEKFYKKLGYITYGEIFEDAGIDAYEERTANILKLKNFFLLPCIHKKLAKKTVPFLAQPFLSTFATIACNDHTKYQYSLEKKAPFHC